MRKPVTTEETLRLWIERDLSADAASGTLRPAFCIDDQLRQLDDIVMSDRAAILVGESGVGKSSIFYEVIRRLRQPVSQPPLRMMERLSGRRILQISLRRRAAGLRQPHSQMGEEMLALVDALVAIKEPTALFFRDIDLAFQFNLETHFENLAFKFDGPIVAEGLRSTVQNMLEYHPDLDQHFVTLVVEEPSLQHMHQILAEWSRFHTAQTGIDFSQTALHHALYLSHRFLSRARMPRKALDLIEQVAATTNQKSVTVTDVINRFCDNHRVPRDLVDPDIILDLSTLHDHFTDRVLGQKEAISVVIDVIGLIKSGMSDARRPFGVFLFVGPTGVGKTHLAQLLAEFLFGNKERLIRINMADYSEPGKAETLFGSPNGATPTVTRGVLAQRVSGHPFAVLLLDEFEKAHHTVHDRLLQLMDEGSFINGAGETVSCRSMIIIATSNAGAEVYRSEGFGFAPNQKSIDSKDAELSRRLRETFRFEFLNRFDRIVHFRPLSRDHIRIIALREFDLIKKRAGFSQRNLKLDIEESLIDWISIQGYHPDYGARFLRRTIERHVATAIATAIVGENPSIGATITATIRLDKVIAYVSQEHSDTPPKKRKPFVSQPIAIVDLAHPDFSEIRANTEQVLDQATSILDDWQSNRNERTTLLGKMEQPSLWKNNGKRLQVLDRFREIEVVLRAETRAVEAIDRLREEYDAAIDSPMSLWRLHHRLQEAQSSLTNWKWQQAERNHNSLWMMISCSDPGSQREEKVKQLTELELSWCRRLGLDANVIAFSEGEAGINRTFISVEGVGAKTFLSMEQGLHHFAQETSNGLHCECEIWDKSLFPPANHRLRSSRSRTGPFSIAVDCKSEVLLPKEPHEQSARTIEICGHRYSSISTLVAELDRRADDPPHLANVIARTYGLGTDGIRDPRTGVTMARMKDVKAGNLDRFLEAWRTGLNSLES